MERELATSMLANVRISRSDGVVSQGNLDREPFDRQKGR